MLGHGTSDLRFWVKLDLIWILVFMVVKVLGFETAFDVKWMKLDRNYDGTRYIFYWFD